MCAFLLQSWNYMSADKRDCSIMMGCVKFREGVYQPAGLKINMTSKHRSLKQICMIHCAWRFYSIHVKTDYINRKTHCMMGFVCFIQHIWYLFSVITFICCSGTRNSVTCGKKYKCFILKHYMTVNYHLMSYLKIVQK
jgi:hypothetical protein